MTLGKQIKAIHKEPLPVDLVGTMIDDAAATAAKKATFEERDRAAYIIGMAARGKINSDLRTILNYVLFPDTYDINEVSDG